jgi:hypothetical protein
MIPISIEFVYDGDIDKLIKQKKFRITRENAPIPIIYIDKIDSYRINIFLQGELMVPIDLSNYHKIYKNEEIDMILKVMPGSKYETTERIRKLT